MVRLCLNMIVKNESAIIERLLETVRPIIDAYCICDTGSTDNTVEIIKSYMEKHNIPGEVCVEPFKNFGYNRTFALRRADAWGDYVILLDADMKLRIEPEFNKDDLKFDGYRIMQKSGSLEYYNTRFIKTGIGATCVGATHEYYNFPSGCKVEELKTIWIDDIGDGGCKADKFERDIRLLTESLKEDPNNDRTNFYLANSYKNFGNREKAIEHYKKRIEIGGWKEEVFQSYYEIGNCYKDEGKWPEAIHWYLLGYNYLPTRAESIYEVIKFYRENGKNRIGYLLCQEAVKIPYPVDDVLFIRADIYNYKMYYEYSILAYYTGGPIDQYKMLELIGHNDTRGSSLSNFKFYAKCITIQEGAKVHNFTKPNPELVYNGKAESFFSSTPSLIPFKKEFASEVEGVPPRVSKYLMNVRYVNYQIAPNGSYILSETGKITTLQKAVFLDENLNEIHSYMIDKVDPKFMKRRYNGVEDVKVFAPSVFDDEEGENAKKIIFIGTVENPSTGVLTLGGGLYPSSTDDPINPFAYASPHGRACEKNWAIFESEQQFLYTVYEWSPLTIYEYMPHNPCHRLIKMDEKVPKFFKDLRGSSNGCSVPSLGEVWFVCHFVEYSMPRHYYHIVVVLDAKTMSYKRHSKGFKFEGTKIEFSLGIVVEVDERILITYSNNDSTAKIVEMEYKKAIEFLF